MTRTPFLKEFMAVCILFGITHALTRPPTPTITGASCTNGQITIEGNMPSGEQCHAVLLTDLSASLINTYESGSSLNPFEGAAVSYTANSFPIAFTLGDQTIERYFLAVAASKKDSNNVSVYSGWRIYTDSSGVPISLTTSRTDKKETVFYRARKINERNDSLVVVDFKFSLPTANASDYSFTLKRGTTQIVSFADLSTIADSVNSIASAITSCVINNNTLVMMRQSNGFYLYNIYTILSDYGKNANDRLNGQLIKNTGEVDTAIAHIGIYGDSSYQNMISTVYDLLRVGDTVTNPIFPGTLQTINSADSLKAKLLITAMLDLSLPHNSPAPNSNEAAGGIFTNYIQCMDNIVRNWSTIRSGGIGLPRLRNIHENILSTNLDSVILDPIYVKNHGTLAEYGQPIETQKRKSYAFYEGYSRLNVDLAVRPFGSPAVSTAAGLMFRISPNIELYEANFSDTFNLFNDILLNGSDTTRRIIKTINDSTLYMFDSNGIWVKGNDAFLDDENQYYIGIEAIRLPMKTSSCSISVDSAFIIPNEGSGNGDITGTILNGPERSLVKMYALEVNPDGKEDTLRNAGEPEVFLHGQRRIVEIDSNFLGSGHSIQMDVFGLDTNRNKIYKESTDRYSMTIKDTSQLEGQIVIIISKDSRPGYIQKRVILVSKLFSDLAINTNLKVTGLVNHPMQLKLVDVATLKLNKMPGLDAEGKVKITMPADLTIYTAFDCWNEIASFTQSGNTKKWEGCWLEYKNLLAGKEFCYVRSKKMGAYTIKVILEWPPWLNRNAVRNIALVPQNTSITENVNICYTFNKIILEPICSDIVTGTLAEVYNPSCVALNSDASFKIEVNSDIFPQNKITWRSENGSVKFVGSGGALSAEGKGSIVKVRGLLVGEDKLVVDIDGYDGVKPEISLDVLAWKDVNVGTWIVNDGAPIPKSAFTDQEVDDAFEYVNQIFKQIAVRLVRVPLVVDVGNNPDQADYYVLPNEIQRDALFNMRTYNSSDNIDLEVYFIDGHTMPGEPWAGVANSTKGVIMTKRGKIETPKQKPSFKPVSLAHELLHCMRNDPTVIDLRVWDIYQEKNGRSIHPAYKANETYLTSDWGKGYYPINTTQVGIMTRLLMYGVELEDKVNIDIPRGTVYGVDMNGNVKNINCGGITDLKNRVFKHNR